MTGWGLPTVVWKSWRKPRRVGLPLQPHRPADMPCGSPCGLGGDQPQPPVLGVHACCHVLRRLMGFQSSMLAALQPGRKGRNTACWQSCVQAGRVAALGTVCPEHAPPSPLGWHDWVVGGLAGERLVRAHGRQQDARRLAAEAVGAAAAGQLPILGRAAQLVVRHLRKRACSRPQPHLFAACRQSPTALPGQAARQACGSRPLPWPLLFAACPQP